MAQDPGGGDELTEHVVAIWRSVLPAVEIDADSHFFDMGATSIAAMQIRARIRADLGKDVELVAFMQQPTPRKLASVIAAAPAWHGS
jgi:acyl carrier protein